MSLRQLAFALTVTLSTAAAAQTPGQTPPVDPAQTPAPPLSTASAQAAAQPEPAAGEPAGFAILDRQDGSSRSGAELSYISLKGSGSTTLVRFEGHLQYVDPASGFGGYVHIPIAYASGNNDSATAIGGLEAGVILAQKLGPDASITFHAGVVLPTASSEDGSGRGFVNLFAAMSRPTDLYLVMPESTSLRVGASPMWRSGNVFGRLDFGYDANVSNTMQANIPSMFHVNAGIGIAAPSVVFAAELSNVRINDDNGSADESSKWLNSGAVSARFRAGAAQPYVAVVFPLDKDAGDFMSNAITVGIDGKLR